MSQLERRGEEKENELLNIINSMKKEEARGKNTLVSFAMPFCKGSSSKHETYRFFKSLICVLTHSNRFKFKDLKGFIADLHVGVVLDQLFLFRSVAYIVNYH